MEEGHTPIPARATEISGEVMQAGIVVHRALGPGLLEAAYETCLEYELRTRGLAVVRQRAMPIVYREVKLDGGFRLDLVVEEAVIVEVKAVEALAPIHTAQVLTYLRLSGLRLGMLMNFNVLLMKNGVKRLVL